MRNQCKRSLSLLAAAITLATGISAPECRAGVIIPLKIKKIYWEYNSSARDLGVHVSLDGEDWKRLRIINPFGRTIFNVEGKAAYEALGMTELFFEGAEPALADFPLRKLLALFPEGQYKFTGKYADGADLKDMVMFSHAIPDGPVVSADVGPGNSLVIRWEEVTSPPEGFPSKPINVVGYQAIVSNFLVTVPATARSVTVPPEFVASLAPGVQPYEVLAIEASGNQTLTEGTFILP